MVICRENAEIQLELVYSLRSVLLLLKPFRTYVAVATCHSVHYRLFRFSTTLCMYLEYAWSFNEAGKNMGFKGK